MKSPNLLDPDVDHLTEHFHASRISYSTQALPINVLLDTLVRPNGDTEDGTHRSNVEWRHMAEKVVSHLVVGNTVSAGGQWVENPVKASWDIETLSYASMLSLPGYSFPQHFQKLHRKSLPHFMRPSRREVAEYLKAYPSAVGIDDVLICGQRLSDVSRTDFGFFIGSHNVHCKHLILASGIFSQLIPPRPLLEPLASLSGAFPGIAGLPILVVGSGFTAADVIISTPKHQTIIHIFKWAPNTKPSPLKACHQEAYPEYAGVYRRMKLAATSHEPRSNVRSRNQRRRSSTPFLESRDWEHNYEGLPNTVIESVELASDSALLTLRNDTGIRFQRRISRLAYVIGRRGSLAYLDDRLRAEVMDAPHVSEVDVISGQTLRAKSVIDLEVATNVFAIGSLTGDSLIRFSYGGCAYAAGKILSHRASLATPQAQPCRVSCNGRNPKDRGGRATVMNGIDGHGDVKSDQRAKPLDRRKGDDETATAVVESNTWLDSGCLGDGMSTISRNVPTY